MGRINGENSIEAIYKFAGERIRQRRTRLRMKQSTLALLAGISRTSLANIERGEQRFKVHTLLNLASGLRVDPARLLGTNEQSDAHGIEVKLQDVPTKARRSIQTMLTSAGVKK